MTELEEIREGRARLDRARWLFDQALLTARAHGYSNRQIGDAAGMSRQGASQALRTALKRPAGSRLVYRRPIPEELLEAPAGSTAPS